MYLTNENLSFVKKNESLFVSMKYLDSKGNLNQIDSAAKNVLADSNNHGFEINKNLCLLPIASKAFPDPFRALPTTSFLCTNIVDELNVRKYAGKLIYDFSANMVASFEAELRFWVDGVDNDSFSCDPYDSCSNLRSDILETLESINIKTTIHRVGDKAGECVIGFKGSDIIDLADNFILAKFVIANIAANYGQKISFNKGKNSNFKLILLCNNNDGKRFFDHFVANNALILGYNKILEMNNLTSKSALRRRLFNDDCKLEVKLTTDTNFVPYLNFAFVVLYFSQSAQILERLEEREFGKFIGDYKKKIKK
jgi:hypothetical protein